MERRIPITSVKLVPRHMGLMLATCPSVSRVGIHEALDVRNLSQWGLHLDSSYKLSCSCISWNPSSSYAHSPTIAAGSDDSSPNAMAKVQILKYNESTRKYAKMKTLILYVIFYLL